MAPTCPEHASIVNWLESNGIPANWITFTKNGAWPYHIEVHGVTTFPLTYSVNRTSSGDFRLDYDSLHQSVDAGELLDIASKGVGAYTPTMSDALDRIEDQAVEHFKSVTPILPFLKSVVRWIYERIAEESESATASYLCAYYLDDDRPDAKIWSHAYAFGLPVTAGRSQSAKAKDLGISRAAFNKRVVRARKELGALSRNMRSDEARKSYRADKLKKHWRY